MTDPIEVLREAIDKLTRAACYVPADQRMAYHEASAAAEQLLASLSAPKRHERPKGNTPIEELMAEYEADGCDHSNMGWVRAAAQRYVETMEDSQVRCLLHVLSSPKPTSVNDNAVAVNESAPVNDKPESAEAVAWKDSEGQVWASMDEVPSHCLTPERTFRPLVYGDTAPPRPEASKWERIIGNWQERVAAAGFNGVEEAIEAIEASIAPQQASAPVGVEGLHDLMDVLAALPQDEVLVKANSAYNVGAQDWTGKKIYEVAAALSQQPAADTHNRRLRAQLEQEWANLQDLKRTYQTQQPAAHPAITHCDNCGCDWLDNGLNPIGCPYCKQNAWRATFIAERAMRYHKGGMAIEQARIHAETDAARMAALAASQQQGGPQE